MPSLDDTPQLVAKTSPGATDLVPLYDVSEGGNARTKKATVLSLLEVLGELPGAFLDDADAASNGVPVGSPYLTDGLGGGFTVIAIRTA